MKINRLKALSVAICCLVSVLWSEARCMEEEYSFAYDYAKQHDLQINTSQCRIFGNRSEPLSKASSGLNFCPPDNAIKLAVKLPFDLDEKCGDWQIVYHGTSCNSAFNIAKNGFDSVLTRQGKAYGPGVYLTPSWNMATQWTCDDVKTSDGRVFGTVLQCRVKPDSFKAYPLTWKNPAVSVEVELQTCELVVENPKENIVIYGILFKQDPHKEYLLRKNEERGIDNLPESNSVEKIIEKLTEENQALQKKVAELQEKINPSMPLKVIFRHSDIGWVPYTTSGYNPVTFDHLVGDERLKQDKDGIITIPEDGVYSLFAHYCWHANNVGSAAPYTAIIINGQYINYFVHHHLAQGYETSDCFNRVTRLKKDDKVILGIQGSPNAEYFLGHFQLDIEKIY